jgi:hypothetical protein
MPVGFPIVDAAVPNHLGGEPDDRSGVINLALISRKYSTIDTSGDMICADGTTLARLTHAGLGKPMNEDNIRCVNGALSTTECIPNACDVSDVRVKNGTVSCEGNLIANLRGHTNMWYKPSSSSYSTEPPHEEVCGRGTDTFGASNPIFEASTGSRSSCSQEGPVHGDKHPSANATKKSELSDGIAIASF